MRTLPSAWAAEASVSNNRQISRNRFIVSATMPALYSHSTLCLLSKAHGGAVPHGNMHDNGLHAVDFSSKHNLSYRKLPLLITDTQWLRGLGWAGAQSIEASCRHDV